MASIMPLVAGNWKMNGTRADLSVVSAIAEKAGNLSARCAVALCLPATLIHSAASLASGTGLAIGAQDCHIKPSGAHTGDISAPMLADAGASMIIVGHSERRADHAESDAIVRRKAAAVFEAGLKAVVCVGETETERRAGMTISRVTSQLEGSIPDNVTVEDLVMAYEPVWAIGTGLTPTPEDVEEVHLALRAQLVERLGDVGEAVHILYGGSVKPDNAATLMSIENVNGALVGGASLKAEDFLGIAGSYGP